jgi:hypothetical protein
LLEELPGLRRLAENTQMTGMDRPLQIALIVGVFAIAVVGFEHSKNGRYQYSTNGTTGIIVDTRTGEYWDESGSHWEPRQARITAHSPLVDDRTDADDRSNRFMNCIHDAEAHKTNIKDCANLLPTPAQSSPSPTH